MGHTAGHGAEPGDVQGRTSTGDTTTLHAGKSRARRPRCGFPGTAGVGDVPGAQEADSPPPCHAGAAPAAAPLPGTRWPGCAWSTELRPPPPATHERVKPRRPQLGVTCSCPETPPQSNPSQCSPSQSPPHTHAASEGLQPGHQLLHRLPKGFQHRARLVHGEGLAVTAVQGGRAGGVPVLGALAGGWGGVWGHRLLPDLRVL